MPENRTAVIPYPTKDFVAQAAAARLLLLLGDRTVEGDPVHISITGGSLGTAIWEKVSQSPLVETVDWSCVHVWWSDERFLPTGDAERNAHQVFEAFFDNGPVPAANLHVIGASDQYSTQHEAARAYARELADFAERGHRAPRFALSLLGMGPDGHLASLFPGGPDIRLDEADVVGVENSPKPPPDRVSMTLPMINASDRIWFLVSGEDKQDAFRRVLSQRDGQPSADALVETPASGARGTEETLYLVSRDSLD